MSSETEFSGAMPDGSLDPDSSGLPAGSERSFLTALAERYRAAPRRLLWGWLISLVAFLGLLAATKNFQAIFVPGAMTVVVCCLWNRWTQWFIGGATPFLAQGLIYELTGVLRALFGARPVHVEGPYHLERAWFGLQTATGVVTPNEYFAAHHWPAVDLIAGTTYIVYIYEVVALLLFLSFTRRKPGRESLLRRFGWTFFWMSLVGYLIFHLYPAAPPWYVTQYGFAAPHAGVVANPAGAIRWDQLTGWHYFEHYYRYTTDVFGAIPSLHVAFAAIVVFYVVELRKTWLTMSAVLLCISMGFSAVYLQHHYVLDVVAGLQLAVFAWAIERVVSVTLARRQARQITA